jgi:hypothetical protein
MEKRSLKLQDYKSDLKQNWLKKGNALIKDQFGCEISGMGAKTLSHKGEELITVNSIQAAKEISRIYLNDLINHS